jgi:heme oxygenase
MSMPPVGPGLADLLRRRTRSLHVEAERSGVIADLLGGRIDRTVYAVFLRNLLPAYRQMEAGLERCRALPGIGALALPAVYRAAAIEADLAVLGGPDWQNDLPLLPEGEHYAARVAAAAEGDGTGLIGHAYVRYLGDLSGGQVLRRRLADQPGLPPDALTFYQFQAPAALEAAFREALAQAGRALADPEPVVAAAVEAFRLNIALSEAVGRLSRGPDGGLLSSDCAAAARAARAGRTDR